LGAAATDLLLKAVVGFSPTHSLIEVADQWVARRRLLDYEGISTPTLYCAKRALLMEQFVPHNLCDHLRRSPAAPTRLVNQVIQLTAVLDKLGFCPVSPFHSLRTDGLDVFVVDFGQDLGPPSLASRSDGRMLSEAIAWLGTCNQPVDEGRALVIYERYVTGQKGEARGWT
jgi:hypothetical protein